MVATQNLIPPAGGGGVDRGRLRGPGRPTAPRSGRRSCAGHPPAADGAVCADPDATSYVVATVTDESGAVEIRAW